MTGALMCPACARDVEGCAAEGCGAAGLTPPKPVWVRGDATETARSAAASPYGAAGSRRRAPLPRGRPAWGGTAEDAAHMRGDCDPATCGRCGLLREARGEGTE